MKISRAYLPQLISSLFAQCSQTKEVRAGFLLFHPRALHFLTKKDNPDTGGIHNIDGQGSQKSLFKYTKHKSACSRVCSLSTNYEPDCQVSDLLGYWTFRLARSVARLIKGKVANVCTSFKKSQNMLKPGTLA